MTTEIEDLREELAATQMWVAALWSEFSKENKIPAERLIGSISAQIQSAKTYSPPDTMDAAAYDRWSPVLIRHFEQVGKKIALRLAADGHRD